MTFRIAGVAGALCGVLPETMTAATTAAVEATADAAAADASAAAADVVDEGGAGEAGGVCGGSGDGLSFAASTPVATPSGARPIGSLAVGDTVLAYNPTTGKREAEPVQHIWRNLDHDLVDSQLTLAGSPAAGAPGTSANDANGTSSATADSASRATRTTATPTRLHRWVAGGVLAAGLAATLLTTPSAPAQVAGVATTTTATPAQTDVIHTTANHPWLTADRGCLVCRIAITVPAKMPSVAAIPHRLTCRFW